jgi:hypothetical protein
MRRIAVGGIALGATLVLSTDMFVLTQRNRSTAVPLRDVVKRFHSDAISRPPAVPTSATASTPPEADPQVAALRPSRAGVDPKVDERPPYGLPDEGVYRYRTHGAETISILDATHAYPDETYWTVTHSGGCVWQLERDLVEEHTEWVTYCGQLSQLLIREERRRVSFFGKSDSDDLHCDPPAVLHDTSEAVGTTLHSTCRDGNDTAHVDATFLGRSPLTIQGAPIDSIHLKIHGTIHGRANGETTEEYWLSPDTGLTLHEIRKIDATATATFGVNVDYHENAEFQLESLEPTT